MTVDKFRPEFDRKRVAGHGLGMDAAADAVLRFQHDHAMVARQRPRGDQAGDARAEDEDVGLMMLGTGRVHDLTDHSTIRQLSPSHTAPARRSVRSRQRAAAHFSHPPRRRRRRR